MKLVSDEIERKQELFRDLDQLTEDLKTELLDHENQANELRNQLSRITTRKAEIGRTIALV